MWRHWRNCLRDAVQFIRNSVATAKASVYAHKAVSSSANYSQQLPQHLSSCHTFQEPIRSVNPCCTIVKSTLSKSVSSMSDLERIYLDYNATTPVDPSVAKAVCSALTEAWGNPSSAYPQGQRAKELITAARSHVAWMIGASPHDIIFTSGGTEANNLVIHTAVQYFRKCLEAKTTANSGECQKPHIITSNLEHDSIKLPLEDLVHRGVADVTFVPANTRTGRVEVEGVLQALRPTTCLVTIMHANNETGVIQPVPDIFSRIRQLSHDPLCVVPRILLHTDAAQTIGKIKVNVEDLRTDYLTIVGHKFYGPRNGALYVREGGNGVVPLHPMLYGGGQERNLRPGTENTAMIAGLGRAAELVTDHIEEYEAHMRKVRDLLEKSLEAAFPGKVHFNGRFPESERIPNTCNVSFLGSNRQGRRILSFVSRLQASVGAACHSHTWDRPSHILLAIGVPHDIASNALRLSVGRGTTPNDIDVVVDDLKCALKALDSEVGCK